jgi:hypothetical protein
MKHTHQAEMFSYAIPTTPTVQAQPKPHACCDDNKIETRQASPSRQTPPDDGSKHRQAVASKHSRAVVLRLILHHDHTAYATSQTLGQLSIAKHCAEHGMNGGHNSAETCQS